MPGITLPFSHTLLWRGALACLFSLSCSRQEKFNVKHLIFCIIAVLGAPKTVVEYVIFLCGSTGSNLAQETFYPDEGTL
jgi:hypothetical protein